MSKLVKGMCEGCKEKMLALIDERMSVILDSGESEDDKELNQAHCFHFYELRNVILGKKPVFPMEPSVDGPLFKKSNKVSQ